MPPANRSKNDDAENFDRLEARGNRRSRHEPSVSPIVDRIRERDGVVLGLQDFHLESRTRHERRRFGSDRGEHPARSPAHSARRDMADKTPVPQNRLCSPAGRRGGIDRERSETAGGRAGYLPVDRLASDIGLAAQAEPLESRRMRRDLRRKFGSPGEVALIEPQHSQGARSHEREAMVPSLSDERGEQRLLVGGIAVEFPAELAGIVDPQRQAGDAADLYVAGAHEREIVEGAALDGVQERAGIRSGNAERGDVAADVPDLDV